MSYTLLCRKATKTAVLYKTEILTNAGRNMSSNVSDSSNIFYYATTDNYNFWELPEDTNSDYIKCLWELKPDMTTPLLDSNYEIDFTSNTFISAYNRWCITHIIEERNTKLKLSDWTQVTDNSISADKREAWALYRQALRDIPSTYNSETFTWPEPPQ
jgi:hypothetical protein